MAKRPSAGNAIVFVRGFDFGTTDEQLTAHMSSVGTIEKIEWFSRGSAEVTYNDPAAAAEAVKQFQKTVVPGNTRFIDVIAKGDIERPAKRFNNWQGGGDGGQNQLLQALLPALLPAILGNVGGGDNSGLLGLLSGGSGGSSGGSQWNKGAGSQWSKGGGKGGGNQWGNDGGWQSTNKFQVDKSGGELGEFTGVIKSFGHQKNYGFIQCAELAEYGDVFLHGDMKKGYEQGHTVKFTAVLNKNGKAVATNLKSGLR